MSLSQLITPQPVEAKLTEPNLTKAKPTEPKPTEPRLTVHKLTASDMAGPKAEDLAQRRRALKDRRKVKFYKMAWRTFLTTAIAAGTLQLATSPVWLIRSSAQVEVSDNQLLSADNVRALLPVPYPQSLVNVQPEELANSLTAYPPIEAAIVHRRLIPPKLHVQITEKVPVAIALPTNRPPLQSLTDESTPFEEPGLIDAQGYWMPRDSFSELGVEANPLLKVIGIRAKDVATWKQIYRGVAQSPVGVTAIDWSNQDNLILHSELGKVHLGPYSERFTAQISALDQLRSIEEQTPSEQIAFINLQDPENPIIEVLKAADTTTAGSQESL